MYARVNRTYCFIFERYRLRFLSWGRHKTYDRFPPYSSQFIFHIVTSLNSVQLLKLSKHH